MIEIFLYALNAVLSILLVSAFGFALRKTGKIEKAVVEKLNSICYNYLLPLHLFMSIYGIEESGNVERSTIVFIILYVIIAFAIGMAASLFISSDNFKRGAIAQSFFRSNAAIMGVALAELLGGSEAVVLISVMLCVTIILFNALAVVALTVFNPNVQSRKIDKREILLDIFRNPLIRGIVIGLICLFLRSYIPRNASGELVFSLKGTLASFYNAVYSLSKIASPMMLMLLGMQFEFKAASGMKKEIIAAVFGRTVFIPALAFTALYLCSNVWHFISAGPVFYQACMGIVAAPCAATSAIMTTEMGGDGELAGQIVIWSTIVSIFTIFGFITALRYVGVM